MSLPVYESPSKLLLLLESRAFLEVGAYFSIRHLLSKLPTGDGHPVMVYPGFMASDLSTATLRGELEKLGYETLPWKLGRNLGYSPALDELMQSHLEAMYEHYGRKLTLIGWSLGGVYARELARTKSHCVRQVITMGSPFAGSPKTSNVTWLYNAVSGERLSDINPELLERLAEPTPVPSTAIYSKTDGIVSWKSCRDAHPDEQHENIRIPGSHFGLGFNPWSLHVIADRLAQPEGDRKPFSYEGLRSIFFPDSNSKRRAQAKPSRWQEAQQSLDDLISGLEQKSA